MNNKTEKVLWYLLENHQITSWEAIKEFGATRLSAIIFNLRHKRGLNIRSERIEFVDRFGDKGHFVNYILEEDEEEKEKDNDKD